MKRRIVSLVVTCVLVLSAFAPMAALADGDEPSVSGEGTVDLTAADETGQPTDTTDPAPSDAGEEGDGAEQASAGDASAGDGGEEKSSGASDEDAVAERAGGLDGSPTPDGDETSAGDDEVADDGTEADDDAAAMPLAMMTLDDDGSAEVTEQATGVAFRLHGPHRGSTATSNRSDCPDRDSFAERQGEEGWHFVTRGQQNFTSLTATFTGPHGEMIVRTLADAIQHPDAKHAYVFTPTGSVLVDAVGTADIAGADTFNLSHTCRGSVPDEPGDRDVEVEIAKRWLEGEQAIAFPRGWVEFEVTVSPTGCDLDGPSTATAVDCTPITRTIKVDHRSVDGANSASFGPLVDGAGYTVQWVETRTKVALERGCEIDDDRDVRGSGTFVAGQDSFLSFTATNVVDCASLTVAKQWTGNGSGTATFDVTFWPKRLEEQDTFETASLRRGWGRGAGTLREPVTYEGLAPGDSVRIPAGAARVSIDESVVVGANCTWELTEVGDSFGQRERRGERGGSPVEGIDSVQAFELFEAEESSEAVFDYERDLKRWDGTSFTVTFTNQVTCRTTPPVIPDSVSATVTVTKVWTVNGQQVTAPAVDPSFEVDLGTATRTVGDGETATFTGLTRGRVYDVAVDEAPDSLPDPSVFAGEDEVCQFAGTEVVLSASSLTAPGSVTATVTNAYTCAEVAVGGEVEEPEPEQPTLPEQPGAQPTPGEREPADQETDVRGVVAERAPAATLTRTGASTALLTFLGLLAMFAGTGLLRRRPRASEGGGAGA